MKNHTWVQRNSPFLWADNFHSLYRHVLTVAAFDPLWNKMMRTFLCIKSGAIIQELYVICLGWGGASPGSLIRNKNCFRKEARWATQAGNQGQADSSTLTAEKTCNSMGLCTALTETCSHTLPQSGKRSLKMVCQHSPWNPWLLLPAAFSLLVRDILSTITTHSSGLAHISNRTASLGIPSFLVSWFAQPAKHAKQCLHSPCSRLAACQTWLTPAPSAGPELGCVKTHHSTSKEDNLLHHEAVVLTHSYIQHMLKIQSCFHKCLPSPTTPCCLHYPAATSNSSPPWVCSPATVIIPHPLQHLAGSVLCWAAVPDPEPLTAAGGQRSLLHLGSLWHSCR